MQLPKHVLVIAVAIAFATPMVSRSAPETVLPYQQTFILTAYYSPEPGQCCYVKGGLVADKILNGEGHHGADGTAVYPGMLAAPKSYAFGTRVDLPGLGVMTVHDRGGAIVELTGSHRLDVWAGYGEEGLARALAFGVKTITGTVYPNGSAQPAEQFALSNLPAPADRIKQFAVNGQSLLGVTPGVNEQSLSTFHLQEHLKVLGYLTEEATGFFGAATQDALRRFNADHGLTETAEHLTERSAAHLLAALARKAARTPVAGFIDPDASEQDIIDAKRTLRFLGYYKGRTNGEYNDALFSAILRFQQDSGLVGTANDTGAGRIGPITKQALTAQWNKRLVARKAGRMLDAKRVSDTLTERGMQMDRFLEVGYSGPAVETLQRFLADRGFFPADQINGNYGDLTKSAVAKYQVANKIVPSVSDKNAGRVGPITLKRLKNDQLVQYYLLVRAQGWQAL